ncbi:MAG: adenosine deaminase [Pseudomonadota bacterium]
MSLTQLIEEMPKAELHLHIEGSLEPEMMMTLARRNNVSLPYETVEDIRAAYKFSNLQDFLDVYYLGMSVLITREDFFDLTWAYLQRVAAQNVVHVEIFFDPQGHTSRDVSFDTALSGITDALDKAKRDLGVGSKLIMCFLRHLDEDSAFEALAHAQRCKEHILAVGLDSSELGNPPEKFARVFKQARQDGFLCVAHAGEEGPPEYVWEALDILGVDRVDHGNRALEDPALVARLVADKMPLTVCPLSNKRLQVVPDLRYHPIRKMLDAGLLVTVNSDDPSYFGGYMTENFQELADAVQLTGDEIKQLGRNAFTSTFLPDAEKTRLLEAYDAIANKLA